MCPHLKNQTTSLKILPSSVTQLCLTLQLHGLQHTRLPCPSWLSLLKLMSIEAVCHPTLLSFVAPLSSCPQSFPASGSSPMSQFFPPGGQSIGALASASVLPMNIQDWFPFGLTGLISLQSKGLSRVFCNPQFEASILCCSTFFMIQLSHLYMTIG